MVCGRWVTAHWCPIPRLANIVRRPRNMHLAKAKSSLKTLSRAFTERRKSRSVSKRSERWLRSGRRTGVARILGVNFSGFLAWFLWRGIYWSKLPRMEKKVRVAIDWALDVFFSKDFVQYLDQRALAHTQTETRTAPWNREQLSVPDKSDNPEMTGARETVRNRIAA